MTKDELADKLAELFSVGERHLTVTQNEDKKRTYFHYVGFGRELMSGLKGLKSFVEQGGFIGLETFKYVLVIDGRSRYVTLPIVKLGEAVGLSPDDMQAIIDRELNNT